MPGSKATPPNSTSSSIISSTAKRKSTGTGASFISPGVKGAPSTRSSGNEESKSKS